jgi:hypothetical protein
MHRDDLRQLCCGQCGKTYTEPHGNPFGEMTVPAEKAILTLRMQLEESGTVSRIAGQSRNPLLRGHVVAV